MSELCNAWANSTNPENPHVCGPPARHDGPHICHICGVSWELEVEEHTNRDDLESELVQMGQRCKQLEEELAKAKAEIATLELQQRIREGLSGIYCACGREMKMVRRG
jgi:hypothetical protein